VRLLRCFRLGADGQVDVLHSLRLSKSDIRRRARRAIAIGRKQSFWAPSAMEPKMQMSLSGLHGVNLAHEPMKHVQASFGAASFDFVSSKEGATRH
jgi:hypothetical protein